MGIRGKIGVDTARNYQALLIFLEAPFPVSSLVIIIVGLTIAFSIWLLFYKTKAGKILRAVSSDRLMANCIGLNVPLLFTATFMMGAWLAGIGGVLGTLRFSFTPGTAHEYLVYSFAVVVIGGLGSFAGAFFGSLIVGFFYILGVLVISELAMSFVFMLLLIVLIIRPHGLFGKMKEARQHPLATESAMPEDTDSHWQGPPQEDWDGCRIGDNHPPCDCAFVGESLLVGLLDLYFHHGCVCNKL